MAEFWEPAWSTEVKIEGGGRFPLGLNRFHSSLEDMLIKSVTVLASRLRYFTYCCWIIGDISRHLDCKEYSDFIEAFRRRENALSLGLFLIETDQVIYGKDNFYKMVDAEEPFQNCSFKLMHSVELGAFGLYYSGSVYSFGLTETNEDSIITPTDSGMKLYEIADNHYAQKAPTYYKQFKGSKEVPTESLKEWAEINLFSTIKKPECREERDFFKSVIFHLDNKSSDFRRDTFALFLECINACNEQDIVFDEDKLRNIHYYSCFKDLHNGIISFNIPDYLKDAHFYWQIYEGHVYFRWWLNLLFKTFIEHLKESDDNGSTIDEFFDLVDEEEFNSCLHSFTGDKGVFYDGSMIDIIKLFPQPCKLNDLCSEEALTYESKKQSMPCKLSRFVLIMAALFIRFKKLNVDTRYQHVVQKQVGNLWFNVLYSINFENLTVKEFLYKMLKVYCLKQHDQIMLEKRDLRKSWFSTIKDKYYFNSDVSLIWRPAKYETIMHYLSDMNLIDKGDGFCHLTDEGIKFYNSLKDEYYS